MKEHIYYTTSSQAEASIYTGFTGDLMFRIKQHKEGAYEGYSKRYNCNRIVWFERYSDVHLAIAREKQLKGWTRSKKIALIKQDNPTWIDLSEGWGEEI